MIDKSWGTNLVFAGAKAFYLLQQGRKDDARRVLESLSPRYQLEDMGYLLRRLEKIKEEA